MEQEIEKISTIDTHSPEYTVSKNYLDTLFALPWNDEKKEREDISKSKKILDRESLRIGRCKRKDIRISSSKKIKSK